MLERFHYRLKETQHNDRSVLKGAKPLISRLNASQRRTQGQRILRFGNSEADAILTICRGLPDDGRSLRDIRRARLSVKFVREELEYGGLYLKTNALVDGVRLNLAVDIGCSNAAELIEKIAYIQFELPPPTLRICRLVAISSETFRARIKLGVQVEHRSWSRPRAQTKQVSSS